MANELIITEQTFELKDIIDQLPGGQMKKKLYFQSELKALENGNARFGIIAYPAWFRKGKWELGFKIEGKDTGVITRIPFNGSIGFANNELILSLGKKKKKQKKKKYKKQKKLMSRFEKISCDPKLVDQAVFRCATSVSENPHLQYDVTLEGDGTSVQVRTNPSPPENPAY